MPGGAREARENWREDRKEKGRAKWTGLTKRPKRTDKQRSCENLRIGQLQFQWATYNCTEKAILFLF